MHHDPLAAVRGRPFIKMNGLGNDFLFLDARSQDWPRDASLLQAMADRHRGAGADQIIVLENCTEADVRMLIYNADGSKAGACGNATRALAWLLHEESGKAKQTILTSAGLLRGELVAPQLMRVNMGPPKLEWQQIPLAQAVDTLHLPKLHPALPAPTAVSMGNPHCVFVVPKVDALDIAALGAPIERHALFPERTNVEFIEILDRETIRMRVWERGAGITAACGSGACAAGVAAMRHDLTERKVRMILDGGELTIEWAADGVWMTGTVAHNFRGVF